MRENQRTLTGVVTSDKMEQTIVVRVERSYRHPLYGKVVRSHRKYVAHDANNDCRIGDTVSIRESRPLSKTKRWVVDQILNREELPGQ
ncbi:MAG: 30S ribosomal protein S17 [Dehalococcoidia bacterium]|nr:30S ribosomal protein S17 [Dehalococcoidia bacterium]